MIQVSCRLQQVNLNVKHVYGAGGGGGGGRGATPFVLQCQIFSYLSNCVPSYSVHRLNTYIPKFFLIIS